jgi:tRNA modification GTPase
MPIQDTICAPATAYGIAAISVIRISGDESFKIINNIISQKISSNLSHTIILTKIADESNIIDEVLISIFKGPKSYTGEDVIEINCHGSIFIQQKILELLIKNGARLAKPGEFTFRAFMNGKLDLSQAEAVGDLIASQNKLSHQVAMNQMRGGFSHILENLRKQLLYFISLIELELDFSEEDVEFADRTKLLNLILEINSTCEKLANSFKVGNVLKNGIPIAIVGKPNTGKSTLLNALLNEEKAIVSEIPGTTRDTIEDVININGLQLRFIDTAGIRDTIDTIEILGIEKTFDKIKKASVILLMIDATENITDIHDQLKKIHLSNDQSIAILLNKIDKISNDQLNIYLQIMSDVDYITIPIAAKQKMNLNKILDFIIESANIKNISNNEVIITNIRHYEALEKTITTGKKVIENIKNKSYTDIISEDIREMLNYIGDITGEITTDEILGNIFKTFCIGK